MSLRLSEAKPLPLFIIDPARKQWHLLPTLSRKKREKGWGTLTVFNCRIIRWFARHNQGGLVMLAAAGLRATLQV